MLNDDQKPAMPEPPSEAAVQCSAWLAAVEENIKAMKYRQEECRRKAQDETLKANAIMQERNNLEILLYKAGLRS